MAYRAKKGSYKQTTDYNAMMQPLLITEEDVNRSEKVYTKTVYDESGRVTFSSFPFSAEGKGMDSPSQTGGTRYFYDGLGRIISTYPTGGMPARYMPLKY